MDTERVSIEIVMEQEDLQIKRARQAMIELGSMQPDQKRVAVCLSGGGIRSASYSMGVLQALAESKLLAKCDYLSAVSGGGYALGWWTALVRNRIAEALSGQRPMTATDTMKIVAEAEREISANYEPSGSATAREVLRDPEVRRYVRAHGNYLTVRVGPFAADTWTAIATMIRNLVFGLATLGFGFAGISWLIWICIRAVDTSAHNFPYRVLWAGVACMALSRAATCFAEHDALAGKPATFVTTVWKASLVCGVYLLAEVLVVCLGYSDYKEILDRNTFENGLGITADWITSLDLVCGAVLAGCKLVMQRRETTDSTSSIFGLLNHASRVSCVPFVVLGLISFALTPQFALPTWAPHLPWSDRMVPGMNFMQLGAALLAVVLINTWQWASLFWCLIQADYPAKQEVTNPHEIMGNVAILAGAALVIAMLGWNKEWEPVLEPLVTDSRLCRPVSAVACAYILMARHLFLASVMLVLEALLLTGLTFGVLVARGSFGSSTEREWWSAWNGRMLLMCLAATCTLLFESLVNYVAVDSLWVACLVSIGTAAALFGVSAIEARTFVGKLLFRGFGQLSIVALFVSLSLLGRWVQGDRGLNETFPHLSVTMLVVCLVATITFLLCGPNTFSLHEFYRNRLVTAFLGASLRRFIRSNPSNLHTKIDFPLKDLKVHPPANNESSTALKDIAPLVIRPFPIWCAAVNVTSSREIDAQERKAASFIMSPMYVGYDFRTSGATKWPLREGEGGGDRQPPPARTYAPLEAFASRYPVSDMKLQARHRRSRPTRANVDRDPTHFEREDLTVGTAMATSGAAFSPNSGATTRWERAFVMTLLGLRLGRWFPNPATYRQTQLGTVPTQWEVGLPQYQPIPGFIRWLKTIFKPDESSKPLLLQEALANCDVQGGAVYVTDGGHFENLAVYEMIRREVDVILAVDVDCDPKFRFDDLFNLFAKVRADFGVEIEVDDLDAVKIPSPDGYAKTPLAICRIVYSRDASGDPDKVGKLIYCKSTLTGNEPKELLAYRERIPSFPHVSTLNQWFAESAFEAYRTLGLHAGREAAAALAHELQLGPVPPGTGTDGHASSGQTLAQ